MAIFDNNRVPFNGNARVLCVGDIANGNYTEFEADGTMAALGTARVWDDLRVPFNAVKIAGVRDPDFALFRNDEEQSPSVGVFIYWFEPTTRNEEVFFAVQLPHNWVEGSAIIPHVHWTPKLHVPEHPLNQNVRWRLEWMWESIGGDFGLTSFVVASTHYPADSILAPGRHYMTAFPALTNNPARKISSMLICRLERDATHADDTYEHDAGLFEIDFHYQIDTLGSRTETVK